MPKSKRTRKNSPLKKKMSVKRKLKKGGGEDEKRKSDAAEAMILMERDTQESSYVTDNLQKYRKMQKPQQKNVSKALAQIKRSDTKAANKLKPKTDEQLNEEFNKQRDREIEIFGSPKFKKGDKVGFTRLPDRGKTGIYEGVTQDSRHRVYIEELGSSFDYDYQLLRPSSYPSGEKMR